MRASNTIFDEEDSLDILSDEVGSERYNKHLESKQKAETKKVNAEAKLKLIINKLKQTNGGTNNED